MRTVITRVKSARVKIDGRTHSEIGNGLLILLGVSTSDSTADAEYLAKKYHRCVYLRIPRKSSISRARRCTAQ